MKNDNIMAINLRRINVLDVKLALTGLIHDMKKEMSDESTSEYRRTVVLPASIKKWETLRAEIGRQFDEQDEQDDISPTDEL